MNEFQQQPGQPQPAPQAVQQAAQPVVSQPVQQAMQPVVSQPVAQPQQPPAQYAPAPQPGPMPATPQPQAVLPMEGPQHVHHSYIWLGGLRSTVYALIAIVISAGSSILGLISEVGMPHGSEATIMFVGIAVSGLVVVLLVGLVFLIHWMAWKHLYYELTPEEFNLYSGVFSKKRVHVPYQRVQSVDQRASLFQRVFGVCTVSIDTAGGAANKAIIVPYLSKTQAEMLRRELFARKQALLAPQAAAQAAAAQAVTQATTAAAYAPASYAPGTPGAAAYAPASYAPGAPGNVLDAPAEIFNDVGGVFGGLGVDTGRVTYEYGMSNKELVLTGLSNNTAFVLIVIGIIGMVSQLFEVLDLVNPGSESLEDMAVDLMLASAPSVLATGAIAFMAGMVVLWLLSAAGTCIAFGGFKARRRDNRIEVEYGLLQHQFQGVDVDRVQSVVVKQTFIRRLMGYCELSLGKVDAVATETDGKNASLAQRGLVIHPFVKLNRVPEILAGIIPEFAGVPTESIPVAKVALRRGIIRNALWQGGGFWLAVVVALTQALLHLLVVPEISLADPEDLMLLGFFDIAFTVGYALAFVWLAIDIVGAVFWARESSFAYNRQFMQVTNGGLSRETVSFPRRKIQFGYTKVNPFQRAAHTATIAAVTAAGVGGTHVKLIDARQEDAEAWLEWVKPRRNVVG